VQGKRSRNCRGWHLKAHRVSLPFLSFFQLKYIVMQQEGSITNNSQEPPPPIFLASSAVGSPGFIPCDSFSLSTVCLQAGGTKCRWNPRCVPSFFFFFFLGKSPWGIFFLLWLDRWQLVPNGPNFGASQGVGVIRSTIRWPLVLVLSYVQFPEF
jgi:hypothetical protein